MQPYAEAALREEVETFSILGRIGGDATPGPVRKNLFPLFFQYPRSDRRRCNFQTRSQWLALKRPFSILGRIGGDATIESRVGLSFHPDLSVSSVGSEAMQLAQPRNILARSDRTFSILGRIGGDATPFGPLWPNPHNHFQYPRSDRRRCNYPGRRGRILPLELSVSSVGSEAMQPTFIPGG